MSKSASKLEPAPPIPPTASLWLSLRADLPSARMALLVASVAKGRTGSAKRSRTAKLLGAGVCKAAQKVVEEAAEVAIDAAAGHRQGVVNEAADLLYNLAALLVITGSGLAPQAPPEMLRPIPAGDVLAAAQVVIERSGALAIAAAAGRGPEVAELSLLVLQAALGLLDTAGIPHAAVWGELSRRAALFGGIPEKLPKPD